MEETVSDAPPRVSIPMPRAPLTGRERELKELDDALAMAVTEKKPQTVTVIGGAGMGKGRLVVEFLDRVQNQSRKTHYYRGLAKQGGPNLGLVQRLLRSRFGIAENTSVEDAREMLRKSISELLDDRRVTEYLHFLGAYLDVDFPESPFTKALEGDAEQLGRISRAVLRSFLEADARQNGPVILTFEELDQAHDETLALVRYLSETVTDAPILMVVSARPQLLTRRPDWTKGESHRRIQLAPLNTEDATKMVAAMLEPAGSSSEELIEAAVDMAGGSPYLLEQAVRTFFESGTLVPRDDGSWQVSIDKLDDAYLPLSVDDAIAARISSMGPSEREVLERAAAMGSVFWLGALVSLGRIERDPPNLWGGAEDLAGHYRDLLKQLEDRDYVMRFEDSSIAGEEEYAFKHNLERDALLQAHQRGDPLAAQRYHRRVAEWLEFRLYRARRGGLRAPRLALRARPSATVHAGEPTTCLVGRRPRAGALREREGGGATTSKRPGASSGSKDIVRQHRRPPQLRRRAPAPRPQRGGDRASSAQMHLLAYRLDLKSKGGAAHNRIGRRLPRDRSTSRRRCGNLGTGHALFDAAGDDARGGRELPRRRRQGALDARRLRSGGALHAPQPGDPAPARRPALDRAQPQQPSASSTRTRGRFDEALGAFGEALKHPPRDRRPRRAWRRR